jgi:predicted dehydrogenase
MEDRSIRVLVKRRGGFMPTVAVTGTGFIGPVHIEALRRLGIDVKGILGSSPEKSRQAAQRLGLAVAYGSYQEILGDGEVDTVHITSPNVTHLEMASQALLAGKHVVCEKPLALDTGETGKLLELARGRPNLISAVNYNVRFYPLVLHARELVRSSALGDIYTVQGSYVQDWLLFDSDWNWRLEAESGGKLRAVGDIGTHWMDLIGFVTGLKIKSVLADLATFVKRRKKPRASVETFTGKMSDAMEDYDLVEVTTEDWGAVLFHYEGGARGVMNVSQVNAGRKNRIGFEIAGSKGAVAWDGERPNELWLGYRDKANEVLLKDPALLHPEASRFASYPGGHNEGFPDTFKQLYHAIYAYLEKGDLGAPKPFPTFEDGHLEVLLCEKILESHQERCWVELGNRS